MYSIPLVAAIAMTVLVACINIDISLFDRDDTPSVEVGDATFDVEVADTPSLWQQGLSGRLYLEERRGMLFIPDDPFAGPFWMQGMNFPLDFIWIGQDCHVADLHVYAQIPGPGTPDEMIRRYTAYPRAAYTLEVNAGEVDRFGIRVGDKVEFNNVPTRC